MPVVFSPGEAETRPLNPEEIVYTTAQKVADLLGIGPQEEVLVAADSPASLGGVQRVIVTGADYRNHGFEKGDSILIYSDNDPMGFTAVITDITTFSTGVQLHFNEAFATGDRSDYTVALNTYVQNQASFTNGKTRGVKKSHVEQRIKEIQDRIDNVTHNAWRPSIVIAEYINFDTYKPYRRRYYVDYVGSTPLLFRNVQQMLRIELWQGDDYREICSAEARLEVVDHNEASSFTIYMSPGGGGFAKLGQGTGTQQWSASFNKVTTAQSIADLINKEDRVSKGNVTFTTNTDSPDGTTYTLPNGSSSTGSSSVHLHNEFLATANSDYGNGKIKITSMQPTKGGEQATIVLYDSQKEETAMTLSQTTTVSATMQHSAGTFGASGDLAFADYGVALAKRVGFSDVTVIGYTGKSFGLNVTGLTGVVKLAGDNIIDDADYTITQHQFKSDIGAFSDAGGDQARLKDWWIDHEVGMIYFNNSYPFFEHNAVKVSYIYGERYLEKAIEEAATKMVAVDLLMADDRSVLIPEGSQNVPLAQKIQMFKEEANVILNRYKEIVVFE